MGGTPGRSNTILATGRLPRRLATRRLRRIGLRISGKIDAQSKPPPSGRGHRAKAPRDPRIIWVPIVAIQTLETRTLDQLGERLEQLEDAKGASYGTTKHNQPTHVAH